jgi:hypothetical protein
MNEQKCAKDAKEEVWGRQISSRRAVADLD